MSGSAPEVVRATDDKNNNKYNINDNNVNNNNNNNSNNRQNKHVVIVQPRASCYSVTFGADHCPQIIFHSSHQGSILTKLRF